MYQEKFRFFTPMSDIFLPFNGRYKITKIIKNDFCNLHNVTIKNSTAHLKKTACKVKFFCENIAKQQCFSYIHRFLNPSIFSM